MERKRSVTTVEKITVGLIFQLLLKFFEHHALLAEMVKNNDRDGFIKEFEKVTDFFGSFATKALEESGYLINRLADRFA